MRLFLKIALILTALSSTAFAGRDVKNFYFLNAAKMTTQSSEAASVVIAFDPETSEFVWNDSSENNEWTAVGRDILDESLRDVKTAEEIKVIDEHIGTYYKMRVLTDSKDNTKSIGLDLGLRLNGGGPGLAVACGIVCKVIGTLGCGAGAFLLAATNPVVGLLYGGVCSALDAGGTASCITVCLALPTP